MTTDDSNDPENAPMAFRGLPSPLAPQVVCTFLNLHMARATCHLLSSLEGFDEILAQTPSL